MARGHSYVNKQKARAKENGYRASVVAWLRALPPDHAVGAYLASFEPPPGGGAAERTEPGDMQMFARTLARAWSSSGQDPTVSHYLLHAESAGREVWRLYKRPRGSLADDAEREEGSRCEEVDAGDMPPVRVNAAGDIVREERRDAHVQAEIAAAQAAAQAAARDDKVEQQRREEEAAEAAAAEKKRAEAAAAAKSSFVATAFRAPGPKVERKKTGKRYKFKNSNFK